MPDLSTLDKTYALFAQQNSLDEYVSKHWTKNRRNEEIKRKLESRAPIKEEYFYDEPEKPAGATAFRVHGKHFDLGVMSGIAENDAAVKERFGLSNGSLNTTSRSPTSLPVASGNGLHYYTGKDGYSSLISCSSKYIPRNRSFDKSALEISVSNNKAEQDLMRKQEQLQSEAQLALAKAQEEARLTMEAERLQNNQSPMVVLIRDSLKKIGANAGTCKRRLSRQLLTNMSLKQLESISADLEVYIQYLNDSLVKMLMERDELHMKQDSMLVDIEDITRYMNAKQNETDNSHITCSIKKVKNNTHTKVPTKFNRFANFIKN